MTRVIKIGGRPQSDARLPELVANAAAGSEPFVIVHGGGDEVSTLQATLGGSTKFIDGRRVTLAQDIEIVRMALSGSANKRLVAKLVDRGLRAVGVSGEDAALIAANPADPERLGFVGVPTAASINVAFLEYLLAGGYTPVISPVSRDASGALGSALNVNGDDAAAAIAVALGASELLLVADVEGVMSDGVVVPRLTAPEARRLIENGTAAGGMKAKLEAGLRAVTGGVVRVRISDLSAIGDLARGTVLRAIGELS